MRPHSKKSKRYLPTRRRRDAGGTCSSVQPSASWDHTRDTALGITHICTHCAYRGNLVPTETTADSRRAQICSNLDRGAGWDWRCATAEERDAWPASVSAEPFGRVSCHGVAGGSACALMCPTFMSRTRQVLQFHRDERRHGSCCCSRERRCVYWRRASDCCCRRRCRCENGHGRCHGRGTRKKQQCARSYQWQHALVAITRITCVFQNAPRWQRRHPQLWELRTARTHR